MHIIIIIPKNVMAAEFCRNVSDMVTSTLNLQPQQDLSQKCLAWKGFGLCNKMLVPAPS